MVPPKHNYFHRSKTFAYNDQVDTRGWICIKKIDLQEDQLANLMVHKMSFLSVILIFLTLNWLWLNHTKNNNCYWEEKPYSSHLCQLHSSQATIHITQSMQVIFSIRSNKSDRGDPYSKPYSRRDIYVSNKCSNLHYSEKYEKYLNSVLKKGLETCLVVIPIY